MKFQPSPESPNRPKNTEFITFTYITGAEGYSSRGSAKLLKPFLSPPQETLERSVLQTEVLPELDRAHNLSREAFDIFVGLDELAAFEQEATAGLEQISPRSEESPGDSDSFFGQMGRDRTAIQGLQTIAPDQRPPLTRELDEINNLTPEMPPTSDEFMDFVDEVKADLEQLPVVQRRRSFRRAARALIKRF
ncbi:MAG TPA: hypothetical protein VLF88_02555 [Candidatus Babeliales bacterium]|nr:hypothetical protein [Candidatus Babeliales bacterium]